MTTLNTRDAAGIAVAMGKHEPFKTHGSLNGQRGNGSLFGSWLPAEYKESAARAVYVVWSYYTPIAWCDAAGTWTMPAVRYSATTSKHQATIRYALSLTGE